MAFKSDDDLSLTRKGGLPSAFRSAGATPAAPAAAPTTGDNNYVWQPGSGFRNTGAFRERALQTAQLAARGAEMGEPTSFRGGAGALEPIAVMRGGATTFSPGTLPGRQFAEPEMATPTQAQQAWNRGMAGVKTAEADKRGFTDPRIEAQYGGFRAPGQTVAEIAATKEGPGKTAQGLGVGEYYRTMGKVAETGLEKGEGKKHVDELNKWLTGSAYSTYDAGKHTVAFVPKDEGMARDHQAAQALALSHGFEAGKQHFEDRQLARKWLTSQALPEGFDANAYLSAVSNDPAAWTELMKKAGAAPITPGPPPTKSWWGMPTQRQGPLQPAFQLPTASETVPPM